MIMSTEMHFVLEGWAKINWTVINAIKGHRKSANKIQYLKQIMGTNCLYIIVNNKEYRISDSIQIISIMRGLSVHCRMFREL